ncbi:MAG: hypothetical protein ABIB93_03820 [Chloroflexota bacterium]
MTILIPVAIVACILAWVFRPKRGTIKSRRVAVFATVIPPFIVVIAALVFQMLHNATGNAGVSDISNNCFIVGLGLIGAAILALIGFAVARKFEIVKGIGFGINIVVILSILEFGLLEWLAGV